MSYIIDSSGWLACLQNTPNRKIFEPLIKDSAALIVPTIVLYEVFKKALEQESELEALSLVSSMQEGKVVDITSTISLNAAYLSRKHKLGMADSMIYATAQFYNAELYSQDIDFKGLPGVTYIPHPLLAK